jgi:hypothetical protein
MAIFAKWRGWFAAVAMLAVVMPAWAHIGPPYPIMQNRKVGPLNVEVWSNPDVGTGSFFVILDAPKGSDVPSDIHVQVAVQPVSHRLPEAVYDAWREKLKDRIEYKTVVPFDKEETWHVRVILASATVNGETDTDVAVTPTLLGRWDLLLYLLPFLGIGFLWFRGVRRARRRRARNRAAGSRAQKQP